ncbi:MAG: ABC transporter permease [Caldilineaceae bacterium]|nr:ABC transporter permease [Caldilineaceae bacterium]
MHLSIREFATFDWRRFQQARLPLIGVGVIAVFVLLAALAPFIVSDPTQIEMRREQDGETITPPFPPNPRNLFGTDQLGRDIFARVVFGLRTSLIVGLLVRGLSMVAGTLLGLISGYFPKSVDDVIMRITDIMLAFPVILLAMTVTAVLGPGLVTVCVALALVAWPDVARLVRGQVLAVREQTYVEAARSVGAGNWRILLRHVLPNCMGPIIVAFSMGIPGAIMYEAGLSFFGFGIQPPTPSLGSIISDGRGYITVAPWYPGFPGLVLTLLVLSVNLVGDGLIDVISPRGAKGARDGQSTA